MSFKSPNLDRLVYVATGLLPVGLLLATAIADFLTLNTRNGTFWAELAEWLVLAFLCVGSAAFLFRFPVLRQLQRQGHSGPLLGQILILLLSIPNYLVRLMEIGNSNMGASLTFLSVGLLIMAGWPGRSSTQPKSFVPF